MEKYSALGKIPEILNQSLLKSLLKSIKINGRAQKTFGICISK
jgi:hypothetical protein